MNDTTMIYSHSETIGVREIRNLMELTRTMGQMLTKDEYVAIANIYDGAIERLLKENGEAVKDE
jgi:hypothetical protein